MLAPDFEKTAEEAREDARGDCDESYFKLPQQGATRAIPLNSATVRVMAVREK